MVSEETKNRQRINALFRYAAHIRNMQRSLNHEEFCMCVGRLLESLKRTDLQEDVERLIEEIKKETAS